MPVKIRLARRGRKKRAIYHIVAADSRAPRDGRFIEKLGVFNPNVHPAFVELDKDRALYWVMSGAQPTDTARTILSREGVMFRKHLQVGVNKGAVTQEDADKRYQDWLHDKLAKEREVLDAKEKAKADELAKFEAEVKKLREEEAKAKAEAEAKKKAEEEAAAKAAAEEEAKAAAAAAAEESAEATPEATDEAETATEEAQASEAAKPEEPAEDDSKKEA